MTKPNKRARAIYVIERTEHYADGDYVALWGNFKTKTEATLTVKNTDVENFEINARRGENIYEKQRVIKFVEET